MRRKRTTASFIIWTCILGGFALMEFPGILFINRITPHLMGLPFLYGFTLLMWCFMCITLLFAHFMRWGKKYHG